MKFKTWFAALVSLIFIISSGSVHGQSQLTTESMAANSQKTASVLAGIICDANSAYTLVTISANVNIKNGQHSGAITDPRAIGTFTGGNVAPGTSLNDPADPNAVFSGGIGIESGVCLSTGFLSDNEPTRPSGFSPKVGVEGPNNGLPIDLLDSDGVPIQNHEGEVSKNYQGNSLFSDEDWAAIHTGLTSGSGDPAVLQFDIDIAEPGFLRTSFVFGSDEFPWWLNQFNDTVVLLVKRPSTPAGSPGENLATFVDTGVLKNFSLTVLAGCEELFLKNQMSPAMLAPNAFPNSLHKITAPANYYTFYDHEFGGFSKVLTRETATVLAPGQYTIKFVIQDVGDRQVDSALFVQASSLKLFSLAQGDYNGDGIVDGGDYVIWRHNVGKANPSFSDGDGNGDGLVDRKDYKLWSENYGNTGNANLSADFNRDGFVDCDDLLIWQTFAGMAHCASRFEGDADGDGDVDNDDLAIWQSQGGTCSGGNAPMMANQNNANSLTKDQIPQSADINGDGVVDEIDLTALDQIILGTDLAH